MQNSLSSVLLRISSHVKSLKHLKFSHLTVNDSRLRGSLFISRRSMTDQAFNFSSYHSVGFDLDNCLVRYDVKACLEMEYQFLAEFLVDKGYTRGDFRGNI